LKKVADFLASKNVVQKTIESAQSTTKSPQKTTLCTPLFPKPPSKNPAKTPEKFSHQLQIFFMQD
jgi:hypothetical protein